MLPANFPCLRPQILLLTLPRSQILSMHRKQTTNVVLPSLQQLETEKDQVAMQRILGDEDEEKDEEAAASPSPAAATPSADDAVSAE